MECNHDKAEYVKEKNAFDVQVQSSLNQRKTKPIAKIENDRNLKEFPNFEALTKEEKLEFFEALSFARRNVEKTGTQARERFNTIHDEYLDYFENVREAVTVEANDNTSSSSSFDTQSTYTLSSVQNDVEEVTSRKSLVNIDGNAIFDDEDLRDRSSDSHLTASVNVIVPPTTNAPDELQNNVKSLSSASIYASSRNKRVLDIDQRKMGDFGIEKNMEDMKQNCASSVLRIENESWEKESHLQEILENEDATEESQADYQLATTSDITMMSSKVLKDETISSEEIEKTKATLKYEALNDEEKEIFFNILKEAHDNVYKKNAEKEILPYETFLKRYKVICGDSDRKNDGSTSIVEEIGPKFSKKGKNLRVKLTLTSADNERLGKSMSRGQQIATTKKSEKINIRRGSPADRPHKIVSKNIPTPKEINEKGEEGPIDCSIDEKNKKICKSPGNGKQEKVDESNINESNVNLKRKHSIQEEEINTLNEENPTINDARDISEENEILNELPSSKISKNLTDQNNKMESKKLETNNDSGSETKANPQSAKEEKIIDLRTSIIDLEQEDVTLEKQVSLITNKQIELEEKKEFEAIHSTSNSCDENLGAKTEESETFKSDEKIFPQKNSDLYENAEEEMIAPKKSLESYETLPSTSELHLRSSSFPKEKDRNSEDSKEIKDFCSEAEEIKGEDEKEECQKYPPDVNENLGFQLINEECLSQSENLSVIIQNEVMRHETTKVHTSLTSPEVHLKFQQNEKKESKQVQGETMADLPRSISDSVIRQKSLRPTAVDESDFPMTQKSAQDSGSSLMPANSSDDSVSTVESEEDPLLVPMFIKRKRLPTTKIRVLQDLLKERAKFVEGSISEFKIVRVPNIEIESSEMPTARLYVEEEDVHSERGIKSRFFRALAKFCRCGKKDIGEEENMLENLKGEAVAVDVSKTTKNPASITLNESTMEVLKAAERKKIIQKYWKIS